jgi:spore germination protein GerM
MIPRHLIIGVAILLAAVLGMSIYAMRMRRTAASIPATATDTRPVAAPVAGPTEQVTLFVAHDEDGSLLSQGARIPLPSGRQQHAEELLRALVTLYVDKASPHVLPPGAEIRSVFLIDPGVAVIDVNSAFADGHRSGVLVEELTIASLIHTISTNIPGILRVKILVNGQERDTLAGHADLADVYDVTAVNQLSAQLRSQ